VVALVVVFATVAVPVTLGAAAHDAAAPNGKALFKKNCGSCHTLKAAGTKGKIGPNLDRLKPTKAVVVRQVTKGGGIMPSFKGRLTKAQINAIATYVAAKT
jgi:mono/diheme cytochrome c family protein